MIHTDGSPTIAWADPIQTDPIYRVLDLVHERFANGIYKWRPMGGTPTPIKEDSCKYRTCLGMALDYTTVGVHGTSKYNKDGFEAQEYIAKTYFDGKVGNIYAWNDALDPKSAKRSILRLLHRAMKQRQKDLAIG